jgi:two-component system LytT family sensor kinase
MEGRIKIWYGSTWRQLLAATVPAIPFGLGVGCATGHHLASIVTSLSISGVIYALLKFDLAFIHPLFRKLPSSRQVVIETISGLLEHVLGAWLAFSVCNGILGGLFKGAMARYLAGGTVISSMIVHSVTYTMHSHFVLKEKVRQEEQLRAMATQAELKALKAQINPHFLFNTLNTIAALIHADPPRAEATVERLAEMFRYVLAVSERGLVPLEEELAFVDSYLEIERARFGERLRITREIAPEALDVPVLSLILQPLVENAVQHGQGADGSVDLTIRVQPHGDEVLIAIADQGPGMLREYERDAGRGVGLRNVDERLRKTFGEEYGIEVTNNEPQGTTVTVRVSVRV